LRIHGIQNGGENEGGAVDGAEKASIDRRRFCIAPRSSAGLDHELDVDST
jgi:hypothetical protein